MPLNKDSAAITQLTATGDSDVLAYSAEYATLNIQHVNGTGSITVGAVVQIQTRPADGDGRWYDYGGAFSFGLDAEAVEGRTAHLPLGNSEVRLKYTAPDGSTGHTLDAEIGKAAF